MKGMEERRNAIKENVCLGTIENIDRFLCKLTGLVSSAIVSQRRLTDVFFKKKKMLSIVL